LSEATGPNFGLNANGDNLFIYNGTTAPTSATSEAWIAGFATNPFLATGSSSASLTYLPTALTSGSAALSLGIANGTSNENGAYTAGSFAGTAASVRLQVHTVTNWASFTSAGGQAIPPSAIFTVNSNTNTPPVIASNLGITVRTSSLGNVIAGALLNSIDAEQSAQQLTYRVTTLPAVGTLRFNSTAVVANVTTFTQSDINSGRLSYDALALAGNTSFAFSVSDGSLTTTGSFVLRVIPNVLLNELKVNPPGSEESGNRYQYIEIRGTPNLQLTNAFVIMLDGNGSNVGRANYVISLDGRSLGSNGLLMIKSPTSGHMPAPTTSVVADSRFDTTVGGVLSKLSVTFYLGTTATGIIQGTDYDANNDGTLELLPSDFTVLDSVGWTDGDAGDRVYGGVTLTQSGGTPDASTRLNRNDSVSAAAWYNGDLFDTGNDPSQLIYDATRRSANLPINPVVASLTPGDVNFVARPVISINTGISVLFNSVGNQILGSNLTSTDLEYASSSLAYRVTSLPTSGTLRLNGVSVVANTTVFTQVDIDAGRLTIDAGSAAAGTGFSFSVSNGVVSNSGTFLLGYRSVARTNLRITNYNIASSGGTGAPRTGLSTILQAIGSEIVGGVSRPIDVLALQEVFSQAATTQLVAGMLNTAYGTTAYASGTLNGASSGNGTLGVVFNSLTVELLGETAIGTVSTNGAPRQAMRYRFRPKGTNGNEDFYMYNSHLKSEDNSADAQRRFEQIQTIRANADLLGSGVNVIYTGDFNVYRSSESGYQEFLSTGNGRAIDPINRPGNWNNNASFVDIHTQAPSDNPPSGLVGGGLDDRFDFQLLTASFFDGVGLEYSSGSYRTFANNGTVDLDQSINSTTNTALPGLSNRTTVLNLLTTVSDHLPVVADYYFGTAQANTSPTNINLTNSTIPESTATGSIVGILSSVDANVGDVHTYSLVSGTGSTDNSRFVINGNQLLVGALAALNGPNTYSLRIRSVDQNGLSFEKALSVSISNVAPNIATGSTSVTGTVTSTLTNTGTWSDVPTDTVVLSASLGTVVKNSNGTWIWSYIPPGVVISQNVTITASDGVASRPVPFSFSATIANPTLSISSGNRTYDGNVYVAIASISGSAAPTPTITYQYYRDSNASTVISAPTNAGTYYVRAFAAGNSNNTDAQSAITAFTINPATLVGTATVSNKIFDGTTLATILSRSLLGIIGSDEVTLSGGTASFSDVAVGNNKLVTINGLSLGGASAGNYTVNTTATTVADIIARGTIQTRALRYLGTNLGTSAANNLAADKTPLLPGQNSGFANYTNYSRGLNGVVIDIANFPASTTLAQLLASLQLAQWNGIAAGGFAALPGAAIPDITVVFGGGAGGSARVQIAFPDNTLQNTWLRVTVRAGLATALTNDDVFYFGNVIGDFGVGNILTGPPASQRLRVNATDTGAVRSNQSTASNSAGVTNIYDVNRDGRVNATDTGIVRSNQQTAGIVAPITAPGSIAPPAPTGIAPVFPPSVDLTAPVISTGKIESSVVIIEDVRETIKTPNSLSFAAATAIGKVQQGILDSDFSSTTSTTKEVDSKLRSLDDYFASIWKKGYCDSLADDHLVIRKSFRLVTKSSERMFPCAWIFLLP
jgi:endonuclease/exonuclease/phosphatase family metal-dependent hydrolase